MYSKFEEVENTRKVFKVVSGLEDHGFVSLLDMYGKCGFISETVILFHKTHNKTTVIFNSMIFCYANHGFSDKAVKLFNQMEANGEKLDHLTFKAVLTACSHSGLTYIGQEVFPSMQNKYRIEPRLEHYACMVDLLEHERIVAERLAELEPDNSMNGLLLSSLYANAGSWESVVRMKKMLKKKKKLTSSLVKTV